MQMHRFIQIASPKRRRKNIQNLTRKTSHTHWHTVAQGKNMNELYMMACLYTALKHGRFYVSGERATSECRYFWNKQFPKYY